MPSVEVLILVDKKRKRNVLLIVIIVFLSLYTISQIKYYEEYVGSKQFYIDEYEDEKTTYNLFNLCLYLSNNDDIELLNYLDILINSPDFEDACIKNIDFVTDRYSAGIYKNCLITSAFRICIIENDIEKLESAIFKYYQQLDNNFSHTYYLCSALNKNTNFSKTYSNEIVQWLENLYVSNKGERQLITSILSYYIYVDDKEKIGTYSKEWHIVYGLEENAYDSQILQEFLQLNVDCWIYAIDDKTSIELAEYRDLLNNITIRKDKTETQGDGSMIDN